MKEIQLKAKKRLFKEGCLINKRKVVGRKQKKFYKKNKQQKQLIKKTIGMKNSQ